MSQQTAQRPWYLVIEGAIGVGKTTLARLLRDRFQSGLLLEVFEENPFLSKFYQARAQHAFQTQMFFLLSRYRQQQQQVPQLLSQSALISDYMFAKDRLFAELNLGGDEWDVYQQIHNALAEQIPTADLIVYLQADTEVLLGRIASRDRPYERDMDHSYIESLRQASHFATRKEVPTLIIDTNDLNFVTNPQDFRHILDRIRTPSRKALFCIPCLNSRPCPQKGLAHLERGQTLSAFQRFHGELDQEKGFDSNLYFNYLCLNEEVGELGSELAKAWIEKETLKAQGQTEPQAHRHARPATSKE